MLLTLLLILHVIVAALLMLAVLMQAGKGGGLSGSIGGFGMGVGQNLFGSAGTVTFLIKATTVLAVLFFVTTLSIGIIYSRGGGSKTGPKNIIQEGLYREQKEYEKSKQAEAPQGQSSAVKGTGKKSQDNK